MLSRSLAFTLPAFLAFFVLAADAPKPKPSPDLVALIKHTTSDILKVANVPPPSNATDTDLEKFYQDRIGKVEKLFGSIADQQVLISAAVYDVVAGEKFTPKFDTPLVATFRIVILPPPEVVADWKREIREAKTYWDKKPGEEGSRDQEIQFLKESQKPQVLTIWVSGSDDDFKGWKRKQVKSIEAKITKFTPVLDETGIIHIPRHAERNGLAKTWERMSNLEVIATVSH